MSQQPAGVREGCEAGGRRTGLGQLGQHVVRRGVGGPQAVAVGVDGIVPVHVHVHVQGVQGHVARVHGAVGGIHVWEGEGKRTFYGLQTTLPDPLAPVGLTPSPNSHIRGPHVRILHRGRHGASGPGDTKPLPRSHPHRPHTPGSRRSLRDSAHTYHLHRVH